MAQINCRHFSGYKPCAKFSECRENCPSFSEVKTHLLIVHLGALGAVLRSTSLLKAIKRKYPQAMITWVTDAPAHQLLVHNSLIDRVLTTKDTDLLSLSALRFDVAFVIDKSLKAIGVLKHTQVAKIYGFVAHPTTGAILPATPHAEELWGLGLDNNKKFFINQKPETQLMHEALNLGAFTRDEYFMPLHESEVQLAIQRRADWSQYGQKVIVGLNTGCSNVLPHKKLSIESHREIIWHYRSRPDVQLVLLGGPEDTARNKAIAEGLAVIQSDTQSGLRDGLVSVAACDLVVTGDSLGMHMAIAQKKYVIAWFGPSCAQEIDLFGRGVKIKTEAQCSPCWKRDCLKERMCYDLVSLKKIFEAIEDGIAQQKSPEYSDYTDSLSR